MHPIFLSPTSFIVTLSLFGLGNVYFVYFEGITNEIEYSSLSCFLTVTGAVIAIFYGSFVLLAVFFPKINPAISLNPLFIANLISVFG